MTSPISSLLTVGAREHATREKKNSFCAKEEILRKGQGVPKSSEQDFNSSAQKIYTIITNWSRQ
jgi:hypothetical protein